MKTQRPVGEATVNYTCIVEKKDRTKVYSETLKHIIQYEPIITSSVQNPVTMGTAFNLNCNLDGKNNKKIGWKLRKGKLNWQDLGFLGPTYTQVMSSNLTQQFICYVEANKTLQSYPYTISPMLPKTVLYDVTNSAALNVEAYIFGKILVDFDSEVTLLCSYDNQNIYPLLHHLLGFMRMKTYIFMRMN